MDLSAMKSKQKEAAGRAYWPGVFRNRRRKGAFGD
jgi:hypothetical protein